jgi:hypothetical protein
MSRKIRTNGSRCKGYEVLGFCLKEWNTKHCSHLLHRRILLCITSAISWVFVLPCSKRKIFSTAEQWKVFADVLNESCEHTIQLRASLPDDSAQWTKEILKNDEPLKTLKQQYIEIWNSEERDSYFSKITTTANEIWEYLKATPKNNALTTEFGITVPTKVLDIRANTYLQENLVSTLV